MEDANADNQGTNEVIRANVGRSTGNFKIDEDMKLACAYVFVTTNAVIGTDQDGETYWKKIRDSFIQRGRLASRNLRSLKNRFNEVLRPMSTSMLAIFTPLLVNFIAVGP